MLVIPSQPRYISSVNRKSSQIRITWREPESNGGSDITRYRIRVSYENGFVDETVNNATKLQYEINELHRNTNYTFCIWAVNIVGKGNKTCKQISTLLEGRKISWSTYILRYIKNSKH